MILEATMNIDQLDLVEHATKKQFPDNEIRSHDDRTGKYRNNIWEDALSMKMTDEGPETTVEDLDALTTAEEAEAEALSFFGLSQLNAKGSSRETTSGKTVAWIPPSAARSAICSGLHWASQCPEKQGEIGEHKENTISHKGYTEFFMAVHSGTSMHSITILLVSPWIAKKTTEGGRGRIQVDCWWFSGTGARSTA